MIVWDKTRARVASVAMAAAVASISGAFSPATAHPSITAVFTPSEFTSSDEAVIQSALNFFTTNITSTFSATIDFATQSEAGATSDKEIYTGLSYSDYYNEIAANAASTSNPTQITAVASLGPNTGFNPVTGTASISMTTTLASTLGLAPQVSNVAFSECPGLVGTACIAVGLDEVSAGNGGSPAPDLLGVVQHEFDEILGTSSGLPNGPSTTLFPNPFVADLFRYSAPGVRSYALNANTSVPCGGPTAYFSINGGITNQDFYNNCSNGGDYGDWGAGNAVSPQVQDAFGSPSSSPFLTINSPEVALLAAVGFDFNSRRVPEPASIGVLLLGLAGLRHVRRKRPS